MQRMDLQGPVRTGVPCRLDPSEALSPGQDGEIDRGDRVSPHSRDNAFVPENLNDWLSKRSCEMM